MRLLLFLLLVQAREPDLQRWGPLRRAEGHVLKFANGPAWLKAEARGDWDLLSGDVKKRPARVAVLDALAAKGINSLYLVLPAGADKETLAEWEVLFTAAETRGLILHLVLAAAGEPRPFDSCRDLITRFGHHPGLIWNVGEEADKTYTDVEQRDMAKRIKAADPLGHPVTVHRKSLESDDLQVWPHLGMGQFDLASVRAGDGETPLSAATLADFSFAVWANREKSDAMAHPLPVTIDRSLTVDAADEASRFKLRSQVIYPVYLSGGGLGLHVAGGVDGLTRFGAALDDLRRAHRLVTALPFGEMSPQNGLLSAAAGNFCFSKPGAAYAIYLSKGGEFSLDLRSAEGLFKVKWFNVRDGESSPGPELSGGDWRSLCKPPYPGDVAAAVTR